MNKKQKKINFNNSNKNIPLTFINRLISFVCDLDNNKSFIFVINVTSTKVVIKKI